MYKELSEWVNGIYEIFEKISINRKGIKKEFDGKYEIFVIVLLRLLAQKMNWSSFMLINKIRHYQNGNAYRKSLKLSLKEIPSYPTLRRYWESEDVMLLMERLQRYLVNEVRSKKEYLKVAIDSTGIELKLNVHKPYGKYNDHKKYFGLKLHLVVSLSGLPILSEVTTANVYDNKPAKSMLTKLENLKPISGVYVDAAYDDEAIYHGVEARDLGYLKPTSLNSRRGKSKTYARTKALKKNSFSLSKSKRQIVEQVFGILKNENKLIIPWWCSSKEKIYNFITCNVLILDFDMLFNHKFHLSLLHRSRVANLL